MDDQSEAAMLLGSFASKFKLAGGTREAWIKAFDDAPALDIQGNDRYSAVGDDHEPSVDALNPMQSDGREMFVGNDQSVDADALRPNAGGKDQAARALQGQPGGVGSAGVPLPSADHQLPAKNGHGRHVGAPDEIAGGEIGHDLSERTNWRMSSSREPAMDDEIRMFRDMRGRYVPTPRDPSDADLTAAGQAAQITFFQIVKLRGKFLGSYRFGDLGNARAMNSYENDIIDELRKIAKARKIADDALVRDAIEEKELQAIVQGAKSLFAAGELSHA